MSIQILGLRDYSRNGKPSKRQVFYEKAWRVAAVEDIFNSPEKYLEQIPTEERVNLYFTTADCFDGPDARKLKEQWVIPFDIDRLELKSEIPDDIIEHCHKVMAVVEKTIGIDAKKTATLFSGNGLQFFIKIPTPIMSAEFFDTMRDQYKLVCDKLNAALAANNLKGKTDSSVFDGARLMRLPNTWNDKPHGKKWAFVIQPNLEPQYFDLTEITGDKELKGADTLAKEVFRKYAKPDEENVLAGCEFLKWCKASPNDVSEHQWYAMVGVTAHLPNGEKLTHEYSAGYKTYDVQETQDKYEQAKRAAGPRTCKDIGSRWSGCTSCKNYGAVVSPIVIRGADYIGSKDMGFREVSFTDSGKPKPGKVIFEDLVKQFLVEHEYAKVDKNGMYIYLSTNKKWVEFSEDRMKAWCREKVEPKPSSSEMLEFVGRMKAFNIKPSDWLDGADSRHINFNNGILDRETLELKAHSSEYGFKYVLPYDYDPRATAPRFEKFLDEITDGNKDTQTLLKEFGGYCLSGDVYWAHKTLLLVGEGSNGKSVYMELLGALAGEDNYTAQPLQNFNNPVNCHALVNKLFSYSEETNIHAFKDSSIVKAITAGGKITVKRLYEQPFEYANKAKIIMSCNKLPYNIDDSHGMFRRLIMVKLERIFSGKEVDPFLTSKLKAEASGIYNVLLNAYAKAKKEGEFTIPAKSLEALEEYKVDQDMDRLFVDTCIVKDNESETIFADIYSAYKDFCFTRGIKNARPEPAFSKKLVALIPKIDRGMKKINGKTMRTVKGIRIEMEY